MRMPRRSSRSPPCVALSGCSLITLDLQPKIRPLEEETVEGKGTSKILLLDLSRACSPRTWRASRSGHAARRACPLLARVREELQKAEDDEHVKALIVRINSPGGTITASDILYHEILAFKSAARRSR